MVILRLITVTLLFKPLEKVLTSLQLVMHLEVQVSCLDDYEEGASWTATVTYSNSGSATLSESLGFYTKIGNQVHIQAAITFSAQGSGSGNVMINGLPFTSSGDNGKRINGFMTYATGFSSLNSIPVLYVAGSLHIYGTISFGSIKWYCNWYNKRNS